jgi:hypothetical protein
MTVHAFRDELARLINQSGLGDARPVDTLHRGYLAINVTDAATGDLIRIYIATRGPVTT